VQEGDETDHTDSSHGIDDDLSELPVEQLSLSPSDEED
jgi:hypothetical protein